MTDSYTEILSGMANRSRQTAGGASDATATPAPEARGLVGGRYLPGARLGRGRLGDIFEAIDRNSSDFGIERRVALQIVDESVMTGSTRAAELARCCGALRAAPHSNIVKILDWGRESRAFFVVMELLEGSSLRAILDAAGPEALSEDEVLPIVAAIGDAIRYLHTKQMVYGVLTPENVFVKPDDTVKLLDIPLTHLRRSAPYYVEDSSDSEPYEPDARDDVYALACLTYELLQGRHPFNANSPLDAHRAGLTPAPILGLRLNQWVALQRALALERAKRTPTVADFLAEFGATGAKRLRSPLDTAAAAGIAAGIPRDDEIRYARPEPAPTPPPVPESWRSQEMFATSSAYPPDEPHWSGRGAYARARRRGGRAIAIVCLVAAVIGAAAVVSDKSLRGAAEQAATRAQSALSAVLAQRNGPSIPAGASPAEPRPADTSLESESRLALGAVPTESPAAVPDVQPVPQGVEQAAPQAVEPPSRTVESTSPRPVEPTSPRAVEPASPPPRNQVAEAEPAPIAVDSVPPNASAQAQPPFVFARSSVTVSESQSAVALTIRRSGDAAARASVVWWCQDGTAIANKDFADLGRRAETFAPGETSRTIFVPIVMDGKPEAKKKNFFVHLGAYEGQHGNLRVLSTARVEIDDDD